MSIIKDLYNYRELLKTNITKDIGGKYKHSFLGILWSFINPLLQITVYAFVFQVILKSNIENYAVYLCCGLIPWQYFSNVVLRGAASIVDNGNIIKKVYFPREILPISLVSSEGVNFLISTIIILGFVVFGGIGLSKYILLYFLILPIQYIVSIGVAFVTSSITVYFRDLQHILGIIIQLMFYGTPIVYSIDSVPSNFKWLVRLNPMSYLIEGYRAIFYNKTLPNFSDLGKSFIIGIVLCVIGYILFKKLEKRFAEEL
ncbi:MAG TPA: ABC transporter permease [Clostridiales bacterium]|nr:ABC transporter permease [Clostridiales bacterium]